MVTLTDGHIQGASNISVPNGSMTLVLSRDSQLSAPGSTGSIVQKAFKIVNTAATTWNITFPNPVAAGNTVLVGAFAFDSNGSVEGVNITTVQDNLSVTGDSWGGTGQGANEQLFFAYWNSVAGGATTYSLSLVTTALGVLTPSPYAICAVEITGANTAFGGPVDDLNVLRLLTGTTQNMSSSTLFTSGNDLIIGMVCSESSTGSVPFSPAAGMTLLGELDGSGQYNQIAIVGQIVTSSGASSYNLTTTGSSITYGEVSWAIAMNGTPTLGGGVGATGQVVSGIPITFKFDSSGNLLAGAQVWSNSVLFPSGSYYLAQFYDQNGASLHKTPLYWQLSGDGVSVDISNIPTFQP